MSIIPTLYESMALACQFPLLEIFLAKLQESEVNSWALQVVGTSFFQLYVMKQSGQSSQKNEEIEKVWIMVAFKGMSIHLLLATHMLRKYWVECSIFILTLDVDSSQVAVQKLKPGKRQIIMI